MIRILSLSCCSFAALSFFLDKAFVATSRRYCRMNQSDRGIFTSHVVSQLHALIAVILGIVCLNETDAWNDAMAAGLGSTDFRTAALMISAGYLF
jgi:glucose uptake protein GlcU